MKLTINTLNNGIAKIIKKSKFIFYILAISFSITYTGKPSYTKYEQHFIQIDDVKIRYIDEGFGHTILLIHGHQSRIEEFEGLVPKLKSKYRIIALDLPCSGLSSQPDIDYSLEYYEETIIKFIDKLKLKNITIAGGSLGGNLALRLSRKFPNRFDNAIVWSPASVWPPHEILADLVETFYDSELYWPIFKLQSLFWFSDDYKYQDIMIRESYLYIQSMYSKTFRRSVAQIAAQQLRYTHIGSGKYNILPTLLMVGEKDSGFELAQYAIKFFEELPNANMIVFKNAGHALAAERTENFIKEMDKFIQNPKCDKSIYLR